MKKSSLNIILVLALLLGVLMSFSNVQAQDTTPTPQPPAAGTEAAPAPGAAATTSPQLTFNPGDVLTFEQLGEQEFILNGPYDSHSMTFGLPADWELTEGATLDLFMTVSFNTSAARGVDAPLIYGGVLTVAFNGETIAILQLDTVGSVSETINIPVDALTPVRTDGRHELKFTLDSGLACYVNQQMTVVVHPNSRLVLPHNLVAPSTDLTGFPRPLYQDAVWLDSAVIVVPDQPTKEELQAALTIGAGLGNLTGNNLSTRLITPTYLTPDLQSSSHLILVGKAGTLPQMAELTLPVPEQGAAFPLEGADDGVIQMVNSPWSPSKVVLVASGNSDAGVVKAAQALSTGTLRPNVQNNVAVVTEVQPQPIPTAIPVDQTLADLGYPSENFRRLGTNSTIYEFVVPAGHVAQPDAFFELVYNHSELLNYERSGLVLLLNNQPIGSVRFSDETSRNMNRARIAIPSTALLPGKNTLEVRADLVPRDNCVNPDLSALWVTLWPESNLHLPLEQFMFKAEQIFDLGAFPYPFALDPTLASTAFVLPPNDLDSWNVALQIANYLGDRTNGVLTTLQSYFSNEVPQTVQNDANLLIVGRPSQLAMLETMKDNMPAPFDPGSDVATERGMQVSYRVPPEAKVGYLQFFTSPWNQNRVVLGVLGNSPEGLQGAANALTQPALQSRLNGNFAVLRDQQVLTADTRLQALNEPIAITTPEASGGQAPINVTATAQERPFWVLPVLAITLGLMVLIVLIMGIRGWLRSTRS